MKPISKLIHVIWLWVLLVVAACGPCATFAYDYHDVVKPSYDDRREYTIPYDGAAEHTNDVRKGETTAERLLFDNFAKFLAAKSEQMLFRGVPGNGTQKAILGQQGVAIPRGTALDEGSLIKHVLGEDVSAGVTSWTTDRAVAARFSGPGGTIIEVPASKVSSRVVPRPAVPKYGGESEVLLRGTVQGTPTRP